MKQQIIPFLTDNCVPESVGRAIAAHGHQLIRSRDCMAHDCADAIIAIACVESGQVLVSWDNDFNSIAARLANKGKRPFHRIAMRCDELQGTSRIIDAMSLIEHEWIVAKQRGDAMLVEIRDTNIVVRR